MTLRSIEGVCEVIHVRGEEAPEGAAPDLLIEVPHGATRRAHYELLRGQLRGAYADDLIDFFFVNTDVGAPEAALDLAAWITRQDPRRSAVVLRSLIPRTFIDCNRVIDAAATPSASAAGAMTPGVVRYVTDADDLKLLFARYAAYRELATQAFEQVCGGGGLAVMLHTYAPRSVDVAVDENIVQSLRAAYQPDVEPTWPLRAEVDLITKTPEGELLADQRLVDDVKAAFVEGGLGVVENGTYPLHQSSLAWVFASRFPGKTLCLELRRDLLVKAFTPFAEMEIDADKSARVAGLLAQGLSRFLASAGR